MECFGVCRGRVYELLGSSNISGCVLFGRFRVLRGSSKSSIKYKGSCVFSLFAKFYYIRDCLLPFSDGRVESTSCNFSLLVRLPRSVEVASRCRAHSLLPHGQFVLWGSFSDPNVMSLAVIKEYLITRSMHSAAKDDNMGNNRHDSSLIISYQLSKDISRYYEAISGIIGFSHSVGQVL